MDSESRTPLHYAALNDEIERTVGLLDGGVDPDAPDELGFSALHLAAQQGSVGAVRELLDAGASVDAVKCFGNTPLFVAVFSSRGRGDLTVCPA